MIELRRFKLPLAKRQTIAYDFERASVALFARHKCRKPNEAIVALAHEWSDPVALRMDCMSGQGGTHHG